MAAALPPNEPGYGARGYRDRLLVVGSQFDTLGSPAAVTGTAPPTLPFWVSEVAAGTR